MLVSTNNHMRPCLACISVSRHVGVAIIAAGLWSSSAVDAQALGSLSATVHARSASGAVHCALFSSSDGFPRQHARAVQTVVASISASGDAVCVFDGLAAGTYAVAAYHDENGNGRLDTNFIGIPQEGVGVSRNASPQAFGPPRYEDARIDYHGGAEHLLSSIRLRY